MQALTLFNQNFAVAESLLQLYQVFHGLSQEDLREELRLAICAQWQAPGNSLVQHACNDRVTILGRATATIPPSLTIPGGLDFMLRQVVVVACTSLESFFWDALRENVLTVVQARTTKADSSLRELKFTLGDYISIQAYHDPDERLRQIILKNFERGTLYGVDSIEKIAKILTINKFWEQVQIITGEQSGTFKRLINELIARRNQIAHRADRPTEHEMAEERADSQGLRPITFAWTNIRVQTARSLVIASAELIGNAMRSLQEQIKAEREQEETRRLTKELSQAAAPAEAAVAAPNTDGRDTSQQAE